MAKMSFLPGFIVGIILCAIYYTQIRPAGTLLAMKNSMDVFMVRFRRLDGLCGRLLDPDQTNDEFRIKIDELGEALADFGVGVADLCKAMEEHV